MASAAVNGQRRGMSKAAVSVIGAGPAGLIAAERLARADVAVTVHDRMPSVARKFLMAGRGGLNLTHSEPLDAFLPRYGAAQDVVEPWLERFSPADFTAWAEALGQPTFIGTSGRVFPRALKASPLLRAWLARLGELGVTIRTRSTWNGWRDGALAFDTPEGERLERPDAVLLALGGASWPRLGSDAAWTPWLEAAGVPVVPFRPANVGVTIAWSPVLRDRFAGAPLKGIALSHGDITVRGEAVIAGYGLEGGAVYALSAAIRDAVGRDGSTTLRLDLKPDVPLDRLAARLAAQPAKASLSNRIRKSAGLDPAAVGLLREVGPLPGTPEAVATRIKALPLTVTGMQGLERAISSAGGVSLDAVNDRLMLKALPGVFAAGEMLDWEAPTGGYLLQAGFASGVVAADGILSWVDSKGRTVQG
jgi:uncharacterized flavoprotein (TIGR03862 family)